MIDYTEKDGKLSFKVRVVLRASRSEIVGEQNGALRVRIAAPPVHGAANEELIQTLARAFARPASAIEISAGLSSRLKRITVAGIKDSHLLEVVNRCSG